jgi:hypothetical protein
VAATIKVSVLDCVEATVSDGVNDSFDNVGRKDRVVETSQVVEVDGVVDLLTLADDVREVVGLPERDADAMDDLLTETASDAVAVKDELIDGDALRDRLFVAVPAIEKEFDMVVL